MDNISAFLGGLDLYHLCVYSYGTSVTNNENQAYRLSHLDGVETVAMVSGIYLSSIVNENLGFYGNYGICRGFVIVAEIYLILFVKELNKHKRS